MYDIPVKWLLIEVDRSGGQENPLVVREQVDICPNWPSTLMSLITAKFSEHAAGLVVESWHRKSNRGCLNLCKLPGCCKEAKWKYPELVSHWVYHRPEVLVDIWRYYDMWVGILQIYFDHPVPGWLHCCYREQDFHLERRYLQVLVQDLEIDNRAEGAIRFGYEEEATVESRGRSILYFLYSLWLQQFLNC